jgi:hypothetical protein
MKKKITVELTKKQALLIEIALDCMSRICAGQLTEIERGISMIKGKCHEVSGLSNESYDKMFDALSELRNEKGSMAGYRLGSHIQSIIKPLLFPELHPNESYGVGNKEIGDAQVCYEMVKKFQNFRTRKLKDAGVLKHEPLHYSREPLIKIKEA